MANQLREVLNRFADQSGPVSISQMAREMNIPPGVLHSMIEYWVYKGKLREVNISGQSCPTCGIKKACSYVVTLPRYYELASDDDTPTQPPCACGRNCTN